MTLRELLLSSEQALAQGPHPHRSRLDAESLLLHLLGKSRAWLLAHFADPATEATQLSLAPLIARRLHGEPIQYITGTVVSCQDEKSQIKNREKGMRVLRSRLYEVEQERQNAELAAARKQQVGSGDRSEKIRTYNFPQNRLTDHRIGLTLHQLDLVMEGRLQPIVDALITHYQAEQLKSDSSQAA